LSGSCAGGCPLRDASRTPTDPAEARTLLLRLAAGQPPDAAAAALLTVGYDDLLRDWRSDLDQYVQQGGSLLRILSAPPGRGKTHLARALQAEAARRNFLVCQVDAAADHSDEDMTLYRAFCRSVRGPSALVDKNPEVGLRSVLEHVALGSISEIEIQRRMRALPQTSAPALAEIVPTLIRRLRLRGARNWSVDDEDDLNVALALISGEAVDDTRALGRLRVKYRGPTVRELRKVPGKRDARLWLESVLRILPALGFCGALWILDEHDMNDSRALDRHVIQLRRLADRLVEGRLPRMFVLYLVLDDFQARLRHHVAVQQRLAPVLPLTPPRRVLSDLEQVRGMEATAFLEQLATRIHCIASAKPVSAPLRAFFEGKARDCIRLGRPDVRAFVQAVAGRVLELGAEASA
jgi:hypothetical protein